MNPIAARTDANQQEIVDALRAAGASVECLHRVGHGVTDLLVGFYDHRVGLFNGYEMDGIYRNMLMEVKTASGKLTPDQVKWHAEWKGQKAIVRSVEEALALIGR